MQCNCGLSPLDVHWLHELTYLTGKWRPPFCPKKSFVSQKCYCPSLPCTLWLVQTWLVCEYSYLSHYTTVWIYEHPIRVLCLRAERSWQKYSQVFPSPFSVHGSAVKCIQSVFLERSVIREPLELFWQNTTAAIKTLWTPVVIIRFRRKRMLQPLQAGPFLQDGDLPTQFCPCLSVSFRNASLGAAVDVWHQGVV